MAQKHASLQPAPQAGNTSAAGQAGGKPPITTADVDTAQSVSQMLLMLAKSHPQNIGMGALIMATSLAAREMNIPPEVVAGMFDRTITEVYAVGNRTRFAATMN